MKFTAAICSLWIAKLAQLVAPTEQLSRVQLSWKCLGKKDALLAEFGETTLPFEQKSKQIVETLEAMNSA